MRRRCCRTPLKAYILFGGIEPEADGLGAESLKALGAADLVVAITPYMTEQLKQIAHLVLPIGTFAETSGTYVNLEGVWQSFTAAARGFGESRPGWKVLRVLGTQLGLAQFEYQTSEEVRDELRRICAAGLPPALSGSRAVSAAVSNASTVDVPMYQIDAVVRRAPSLQKTAEGRSAPAIYMNHKNQGAIVLNNLTTAWASLPDIVRSTTISTLWIVAVCIVLILCVAFTTLWERKVIGWMQLRRGPQPRDYLRSVPWHGSAVRGCREADH